MARNNTDWGEVIASTAGTISVFSGSLTVDVCLGETSYELGSGRTDTFDTGSETMGDLGGVSSENPVGTTGISGIATTGFASSASSEDPDGIIIFFRKDSVPYSRIEKQAESIYNFIHKKNKITMNRTAIQAKTAKVYEKFKKLFWLPTEKIDYERILIIEKVLEKLTDE